MYNDWNVTTSSGEIPTSSSVPSNLSLHTSRKPTRAIIGGIIGGIMTLVLVFSFIILYLRQRRSKNMALTGPPSLSRTTITNETPGATNDHPQYVEPFPPPFPAIGIASMTCEIPFALIPFFRQITSTLQKQVTMRTNHHWCSRNLGWLLNPRIYQRCLSLKHTLVEKKEETVAVNRLSQLRTSYPDSIKLWQASPFKEGIFQALALKHRPITTSSKFWKRSYVVVYVRGLCNSCPMYNKRTW